MEAQAEALLAQRQALIEDGWAEVVVGPQADVQDRLYAMTDAPQEYDEPTTAKLKKLADKREQARIQAGGIGRIASYEGDAMRPSRPNWKRWTTRNKP